MSPNLNGAFVQPMNGEGMKPVLELKCELHLLPLKRPIVTSRSNCAVDADPRLGSTTLAVANIVYREVRTGETGPKEHY